MGKSTEEASALLEEMASKNYQCSGERAAAKKSAGMYEGNLSSKTEVNPWEQVNTINLRSGRELGETSRNNEDQEIENEETVEDLLVGNSCFKCDIMVDGLPELFEEDSEDDSSRSDEEKLMVPRRKRSWEKSKVNSCLSWQRAKESPSGNKDEVKREHDGRPPDEATYTKAVPPSTSK
ncbi:hypothetical protein Dimus_030574 [Dionaea muscipula]